MQRALRLWPWLAAVATGLMYRACFAPQDQAWLCWVALVPLLCALWFSGSESKRRWLRDLLLGYVAGVTFFWTVFSWLTTVTTSGWILVGAYMAIYPAAWAWLCGRLRPRPRTPKLSRGLEAVTRRLEAKRAAETPKELATQASSHTADGKSAAEIANSPWLSSFHNLRLAILVACAWVASEFLRATVFSGWGWNTLGHALHAQWIMIQIAEFTGVPGLSFLIVTTNVVLVAVARRFIDETQLGKQRPHFELTLTMVALMGVGVFGVRTVQDKPEAIPFRVAAVQPNIPREQKFKNEFADVTFEQFRRLSEAALATRPELLIWPESSMPGPVLPEEPSYDFVMDFAKSASVDLLLGVIDQDETAAYNAAMLVTEAGTRTQLYRKIHLVPFGEYVPGRHVIPGLARIVGDQVPDDFGFGKEHTVFKTTRGEVQLAPLICFEDTIGELARQFVLGGANLLANVTNDGWFLKTAGSRQHLDNAVFRCVETRLPMVRSGNTGVTCVVNEFGRVTEERPQFIEDVLTTDVRVPTRYAPTFYVRHGELFAQVCTAIAAVTFAFVLLRLIRERRSRSA